MSSTIRKKFGFITFLVLCAAVLIYLSMPKTPVQKEVTKEISITVNP